MSIKRGDTLIEVVCAIVVFALVSVIALTLMNMGVTSAQAALETTMTRNEVDAQAEAIRFLQSAYIAERGFPAERQQYADVWRKITQPYDAGGLSIDPGTLDNEFWLGRGTCNQLYDDTTPGYIGDNYGFIINTRFIQPSDLDFTLMDAEGAELSREAFLEMMLVQSRLEPDVFQQAPLYPRIVYSDSTGGAAGDPDSETGELTEGGADGRLYRLVKFVEGIWVVVVRGGTLDEDGAPEYYDFHIRTCWNPVGRRVASTIGTIVRVYNPDRGAIAPGEPEPPTPGPALGAINYVGAKVSNSAMISQYDGIENASWNNHSNTVTGWKNLGDGGPAADGTKSGTGSWNWTPNGLAFPAGNNSSSGMFVNFGGNSSVPGSSGGNGSIEVVASLGSTAQGVILSNLRNGGLSVMTNVDTTLGTSYSINSATGLQAVVGAGTAFTPSGTYHKINRSTFPQQMGGSGTNTFVSFSISFSKVGSTYYYKICNDAVCTPDTRAYMVGFPSNNINWSGGANISNSGSAIANSVLRDAVIHSVRIYMTCALSDRDIRWNAAVDRARFLGDDSALRTTEFIDYYMSATAPPLQCRTGA